jgi:phosphate uptake regulator
MQESVSSVAMYQQALADKKHQESKRDEINKEYISLFAAIIAITPFIANLANALPRVSEAYVVRFAVASLSLMGLILSMLWYANIKRIFVYLEIIDSVILKLENACGIEYSSYISKQLRVRESPDRITKYQLIMPKMFIIIFFATMLYAILELLAKFY